MPPTLQQPTADPCFCWTLLDTQRQIWVSLLWGHCSFLLGPVTPKVLVFFFFPLSECLFPQSYVSSGNSMVQLMATSSKRAYATPSLLHPEPLGQATAEPYLSRRHSTEGLAWSLWSFLVCTRFIMSSEGKASDCNAGDWDLIPGLERYPWRKKWQPTVVPLPGKSHGWRSL